jgi:hypothetical protein
MIFMRRKTDISSMAVDVTIRPPKNPANLGATIAAATRFPFENQRTTP